VLSLKDTINQMIANLKDTTQTNKEQDWLKTNLAKFSQMMQGQRSLESLAQLIMSELTPLVSGQHGTVFVTELARHPEKQRLRLLSSYALKHRKGLSNSFEFGEGLVGQCGLEKKTILVEDVPDDFVVVNSCRRVAAAQHPRAADPLRGPDQGVPSSSPRSEVSARSTSRSSSRSCSRSASFST
jgi:hypothetical protein